ncbi:hypothetical protein E4U42_003233 [Claviceps africana]|uniref:Uncharacterized protein n=1 Tax=Claviceps africana TaxID=83212 RepID=A0A8K0NJ08_9HYPO|nr:hypothetical protein E4U42_003233 [Claviceps africana]
MTSMCTVDEVYVVHIGPARRRRGEQSEQSRQGDAGRDAVRGSKVSTAANVEIRKRSFATRAEGCRITAPHLKRKTMSVSSLSWRKVRLLKYLT